MKKNDFGKQFKNNKRICFGKMDKFISYETLYF